MDELEAVRPLLPLWTRFAAVALWLPAAFAIGGCCAALARRVAIVPYRRLPPDAPWVLRARHAWPARHATALATVLAMAVLGMVSGLYAGAALSIVTAPWLGLLVCLCAHLGGTSVSARLARELGLASRGVGKIARDGLVVVVLLAPHLLLALAIAPAIALPLDLRDALLFACIALLFACIAAGGALRVLAWLGLVAPAPERLRRAVAQASQALATAEPQVEVVRWGAANAIAYPLGGRLAFSSRALEVLDDDELRAVAAHEIGHLREPLAVRCARATMLFALLPLAGSAVVLQRWGLAGLLALVGAIYALALVFRRLATRMEQRADRAALCGADASPLYARALERLHESNLAPAVASGRPVHPHLYDRLIAAGVPPAWPRPDPPSAKRLWAGVAAAVALLVPLATLLTGPPYVFEIPAAYSERASNLDLAFGLDARSLLRRALLEDAHARGERAFAFAQAASALAPGWSPPHALAALALAREGRCEEAAESFEHAQALRADAADDAWLVSAEAWLEACAPRPALARSPV
jgi:Zn-dependent protease with chaperone function